MKSWANPKSRIYSQPCDSCAATLLSPLQVQFYHLASLTRTFETLGRTVSRDSLTRTFETLGTNLSERSTLGAKLTALHLKPEHEAVMLEHCRHLTQGGALGN